MALADAAAAVNIANLSFNERLRLTIEATIPKVGPEVGQQLKQLLDAKVLAIAGGVLVIWAGLHFTGAGEVADVALLVVGWIALGGAAWQAGRELVAFAIGVRQAKSQPDIDGAADHLASAIGLIGVQAVLTMLLHTAPKPYRTPDFVPPRFWKGWWDFGSPPMPPPGKWVYRPTVKTVPGASIDDAMGVTSVWGDIEIASELSASDARATLLHEQVHAFLTPKLTILRSLRAQIKAQAYGRSVLLRYLEEAMAETYMALRTKGLDMNALIDSVTFPVSSDWYKITAVGARAEIGSILLGPINVGGMIWNVWVSGKG